MTAVKGVGPDAPMVTNAQGGRQAHTPYRFDLMDPQAQFRLAEVLGYGAAKYGDDNWRLISPKEHINHLLQHVTAYLAGDTSDDHLGHAYCRAMMALAMDIKAQEAQEQAEAPGEVGIPNEGILTLSEECRAADEAPRPPQITIINHSMTDRDYIETRDRAVAEIVRSMGRVFTRWF